MVLKFDLSGEGGEQRLVEITKKQYDFFIDKEEDFIRDSALGSNSEVPNKLSLEEWNSVSPIYEAQGFSFGLSEILVEDEKKKISIQLNEKNLKKIGVKVIKTKKNIEEFLKKNKHFLLCKTHETGNVISEINKEKFDAKKLCITISSFEGWEIITKIMYGEDIISNVSETNDPTGEYFTIY
jgi:hypothetical protein